jgi:hypothetical protein
MKSVFSNLKNVIGECLDPVLNSPIKEREKTMLRLPFVKVAFLSVVGSFLLMLGLLAFPATASANTGNTNYSKVPQRTQMSAYVVGQAGSSAVEVRVTGSGFRSGTVYLSANVGGRQVSVQPTVIRTNGNGTFSQVVRVQLNYWNYPAHYNQHNQYQRSETLVLHATGAFGQSSTSVLFLTQPFQGSHYGLIR